MGAVEVAAAREAQPADAWILDVLEKAVTESQERHDAKVAAGEAAHQATQARREKDMEKSTVVRHRATNYTQTIEKAPHGAVF